MKQNIIEEVKSILEEAHKTQDVAEIEKAIAEVKGRISIEQSKDYWEGKTPCWEMCHCPESIRDICPAFVNQSEACWAIEGTYCKLCDYGNRGDDTSICKVCRVYKRYGAGEPIELKILGTRFGAAVES